MTTTDETVHIGFLADESGSMRPNVTAVVNGYNEFIGNLRGDTEGKDVRATLGMFDLGRRRDILRVKFDDVPLQELNELTFSDYSPQGSTPLNDATIQMIKKMERRSNEGDKVMLVIFTDGLENASEAESKDVKRLIADKEREGWAFIYLGANQDAWDEGSKRGVARHSSLNVTATPEGVANTMRSVSNRAALYSTADSKEYEAAALAEHEATGGTLDEKSVSDVRDYLGKDKVKS